MPTQWTLMTAAIVLALNTANCRRSQNQTPDPNPPTRTDQANPTHNPTEAADSGAVAAADVPPAQPAGPHAAVQGEHAELDARITPPAATPGQGTIEVVLQSKDGYHVNELDEVQLNLEGTRATVRGELVRTDATESDQNHVKFVIPVAVSGGNATVHGRIRFSVCSEVCIRQRLAFDVATP